MWWGGWMLQPCGNALDSAGALGISLFSVITAAACLGGHTAFCCIVSLLVWFCSRTHCCPTSNIPCVIPLPAGMTSVFHCLLKHAWCVSEGLSSASTLCHPGPSFCCLTSLLLQMLCSDCFAYDSIFILCVCMFIYIYVYAPHACFCTLVFPLFLSKRSFWVVFVSNLNQNIVFESCENNFK